MSIRSRTRLVAHAVWATKDRSGVLCEGRDPWLLATLGRVALSHGGGGARRRSVGRPCPRRAPNVPPSLLDYVLRQRDRHATGALDAAWELPPWKAPS